MSEKQYQPDQVRELRKFVAIIGIECLIVGLLIIIALIVMSKADVLQSNIRRFSNFSLLVPAIVMMIFGKDFAAMTQGMNALLELKKGPFMYVPLTSIHLIKAIVFPTVSILIIGILFLTLYVPEKKPQSIKIDNSEQIVPDSSSSITEAYKSIPAEGE